MFGMSFSGEVLPDHAEQFEVPLEQKLAGVYVATRMNQMWSEIKSDDMISDENRSMQYQKRVNDLKNSWQEILQKRRFDDLAEMAFQIQLDLAHGDWKSKQSKLNGRAVYYKRKEIDEDKVGREILVELKRRVNNLMVGPFRYEA
jgi:hypothetical protein